MLGNGLGRFFVLMSPDDLRCLSGGDDAFDPSGEFGDACVNPIIIGPSAASAPAHHAGQKPASRRLLTHQRPPGVALTEKHACKSTALRVRLRSQHIRW